MELNSRTSSEILVIAQGSGLAVMSTLASTILRPTGRNDLMEKPSAAVTM